MCVTGGGGYQVITDGLQFVSRLATGDSWGCGGNSAVATDCSHAVGVETCCLFGLLSEAHRLLNTRAPTPDMSTHV